MTASNGDIAGLFRRLADLLEIDNANPFRVRAYRNAADTVRRESRSMADLIAQGEDLSALPDIGKDIAEKIATIVESGHLPLLEEVETRVPGELSDMMKIEGLGAKRVKILYEQLHVGSVEDVRRAAQAGRIRELPGFGARTEQTILRRVEAWSGGEQRTPISDAEAIVAPLLEYLGESSGIKALTVAGSYRRRRETVGDLDILATARKDSDVIERFVAYQDVEEVVSRGTTRSTVHLKGGMQVDLRVVPAVSYGAALHYFTGSKAHNIALRAIAQKKKLKINEYGVYKGEKRIKGRTEEEIYKHFDLDWIPPELRENRGEIDAARDGSLPKLLTLKDIRGDLHMYTTATGGRSTLKDMAQAAQALGYAYIAITEHSRRLTEADGLDEKRLRKQLAAIDRLNDELKDLVVLKSIEAEILEDGSLDLPDSVLQELDLTVGAVHSSFDLPRDKQTDRLLRAMDNPHFTLLAHPTGRLLNRREPYAIDIERLIAAAKDRNCCLEVNAQPDQLDLNDDACRMAGEGGVKLALSTGAHSADGLALMRHGVDQARRGWLQAEDIINTRSLRELKKLLKR